MGKVKVRKKLGWIKYSGSCIQQNHSETTDKGFLFWGIDGKAFKTKHVKINHISPFVTLDYAGSIDELQSQVEDNPPQSHFRIRIQSDVTQADMTQIRAAIKNVANPEEIVFKRETDENSTQISNETLDESVGIDSYESVNALIQEYYANSDLPQETQDEMSKILASAWRSTNPGVDVTSGRWSIKKIEFDNIFGYGENNVVNFDAATGITGIFGKNRSGKSSICGALTYALFNGTDRGPMKNMHIVNARKNYCKARAVITKNGHNFLIERQTTKSTNKKGITSATTHLNLFECDDFGTPLKDLSEEQRRSTEKILRDMVGNLDDFLTTSLASQGDINRFVVKGSAERKTILAKFLRLDILDALFMQTKQELTISRGALKKIPEKQFDMQIIDRSATMKARKAERDAETIDNEKIASMLNLINLSLDSQSDEMYTQTEIDDQAKKLIAATNALHGLRAHQTTLSLQKIALQEALSVEMTSVNDIDFDELQQIKEQLAETEKAFLVLQGEIETKASFLKSDRREVKRLTDVPCDDAFPMCKYIISAKKAERSMLEKKDALVESKKQASALRSEIKKLLKSDVDEKLSQKREHDEKIYHLTQEIGECNMSILTADGSIVNAEREFAVIESALNRMKINLCSSDTAAARETLVKKKKIAEAAFKSSKTKIQSLSERIGLLTAEISQLRKDKKSYEENNQRVQILGLLHKALARDGIPLQIIKRKLPLINREIANILQGVTGFTVELTIDDAAGMDIILNYGDSRRVIECCSGMEKMMASLAIRTALVRVSSLPKSDTLIIDEGFGSLDDTNIEACTALLRSLTKTFRVILIISHVDTVKDVVDNIIEISTSKQHDAKVKFL